VSLAKYNAAMSRTSRVVADTIGQGVIVNKLLMDIGVLA